jgi:hypothetical protein
MTRFDLADDDVLLALLSDALDEADPVPGGAVVAAKAFAQMGDVDAELALLVADSLLDAEVVLFRHDLTLDQLGGPTDRLLSFATPQLSVDVDIQANGTTVIGAITPPMSVDVDLETGTESGIETVSTRSDELGRFHLEIGPGRCRLRIHAHGAAVVTPWITR